MKAPKYIAQLLSATALMLTAAMCVQGHAQGAAAGTTTSSTATSQSAIPSLVEVYWNSSKTIVAPGITNVIVLDEQIARAQPSNDVIQFFGLERGETVMLGYIGGKAISIRVRVVRGP